MVDEQGEWHKIADGISLIPFNDKKIALVQINGKKICLIKTDHGLKACTDKCPHAGGSLSDGFVDNKGNIVCCVHFYKFNLTTGRDALNEGYFLKTYPVKEEPDGIYIKI